jgi:hypothetical protein
MADVTADARRKAKGSTTSVISPLALEAVRRIDALFDIERMLNLLIPAMSLGHSEIMSLAVPT